MDFNNYPNIANLANQLGKVKQTVFNKKKYAQAESFWNSLSVEDLNAINQEAAGAVRVMNCFVTPNYVFVLDMAVFYLVPVKDMVWIYVSVLTQKMNFIPYNKIHNLFLIDRNGDSYTLGTKNTNGFSKKTPCSNAMKQIADIVLPQRKGLIVGYTKETADAMKNHFAGLVQTVDTNSMI